MSLDPAATSRAIQPVQQVAEGRWSDVTKDPVTQGLVGNLRTVHNDTMGENLNKLRSQFQLSGHNLSSAYNDSATSAIRQGQNTLDAQVGELLQKTQSEERQRQMAASSGLASFYMQPFDWLTKASALNTNQFQEQNRPSGWAK